jgi:DNA-binding GntR family transcriptional regulator
METLGHELITRVLGRSVDPDSLVGSIAAWIAGAIIEDRLRPGDDLNSVDLAKQFDTSRTPVREALLILEKEGLVTILPRRRPYVAHISLKEVREIYQVRAHLLMLAAELIVNTASDEAIASLKAALQPIRDMVAACDVDDIFWANVAFRNQEADICGNSHVRRILDSLGLRTLQLRHLSMRLGLNVERLTKRELLVDAYAARDASLAVALTRSMVLGALAIIETSGWTGLQTKTVDVESA